MDEAKLEPFMGQCVSDLGAAINGLMVYLGDRLGPGCYELPEEQAMALAVEDSPVFLAGGYESIAAAWAGSEKYIDAFRSGRGVGWGEHDPRLFTGTARFLGTPYRAHLIAEWIPALDGVGDKLRAGS
jgi:hypothetical protein